MKKVLFTITTTAFLMAVATFSQATPLSFEENLKPSTATRTDYFAFTPYADVEQMSQLYPYALMSYFADMYKVDSSDPDKKNAIQKRVELLEEAGFTLYEVKQDLPTVWQTYYKEKTEKRLVVRKSGLKMRFYRNEATKTLVAAIAGTDFSSKASMTSALNLANGIASDAAVFASDIINELQVVNPDYNIVLTGASQGGAIAQYIVAHTEGTSAVIFNSEFLYPSLAIGLDSSRVTHSYVEGEFLNGNSWHIARPFIRNTTNIESSVMPVNSVLSSIITNKYYSYEMSGKGLMPQTLGLLGYYTTTPSFIRHWTGAILETIEYHTQQNLPSIF